MNLLSLKSQGVELIDQKTFLLFEQRMAGLGSLIGPHFHSRAELDIPSFDNEALFPHIKIMKEQGRKDFFSHGIGRYVPWTILSASHCSIQAVLRGNDRIGQVCLREIEGYDFEMHFRATLSDEGFEIFLKYRADKPSTMGLHYYFSLPKGMAYVEGEVQNVYNKEGSFYPLPAKWKREGRLHFPLDHPCDYGFLAEKINCGKVLYHNSQFSMALSYDSPQECCWQLFRPKESSYICIEPICAHNPRSLTQKEGEIKIKIKLLNPL
jgi:galactose mutarotase-like enzyme